MSELKFTEEHEWLKLEDDGAIRIGISQYAQEQLGDVVYVELPGVGDTLTAGSEVAVIESVKAAGEIRMPINGEVIAVNESLSDEPELVNSDPAGAGWFFKIKPDDADDLAQLMDENAYLDFIETLSAQSRS